VYGAIDPTSYGQAGYLPGVPRLGVPPLRLATQNVAQGAALPLAAAAAARPPAADPPTVRPRAVRFRAVKVSVRPTADGYDVRFTVRNAGTREGVEVSQVYVGPPPKPPAPMAVSKLVGFERVSPAPGQSRQVTVHVDPRGFSYWSTADHRWTLPPGRRTVMVGSSSRSIRLQTQVEVRAAR